MTDAGVAYWLAKNEDGTSVVRFEIRRRINKDACLGTVVYMEGSYENQVFIPDIEGGCLNHQMFARSQGGKFWQDLGEINFGE
jgi:hypothetical protein